MAKPGLPQIPDDQAESVRQHVQRIDASSRKGRLELQHEALDSPVVVGDPLEELGSGVDALERAGADAVHTGFHDAVLRERRVRANDAACVVRAHPRGP